MDAPLWLDHSQINSPASLSINSIRTRGTFAGLAGVGILTGGRRSTGLTNSSSNLISPARMVSMSMFWQQSKIESNSWSIVDFFVFFSLVDFRYAKRYGMG